MPGAELDERAARDQRLVQSVLGGETEAYSELVSRYQKLVASVAWRYGVGQQEIEDIVSEVFIKAYRNLHQYRPEHPFSTWLYRLAANHVLDHGRRARKERGRTEMPQQMADTSPGPREELQTRERATLVREALEQAAPVLLQPVHAVKIIAPSVFTGALGAVVSSLKGQVLGFDRDPDANGWDIFRALLPGSALDDLSGQLRGATQGVGRFMHAFDHYEELYGREAQRIIEDRAG